MKVLYISPLFTHADGKRREYMIDAEGVKYHAKRDAAVLALKELGGIYAPATAEVLGYRKQIRSAKRAIERNGYFAIPV